MIVYGLFSDSANEKRFVSVGDNAGLIKKWKAGKLPPDEFDCRGEKKANNWHPRAIRWFDDDGRKLDRYKDPDITYIQSGSFILNEKTAELMQFVVDDVAELLPIPFNDETWYFLNVFNQVDAFDAKNSRYAIYESGERGYLEKPAFHPDKVPHAKLFKIPESSARIYYAEHNPDDNPNTFKNVLEKNNLFGLQLKKVQEY